MPRSNIAPELVPSGWHSTLEVQPPAIDASHDANLYHQPYQPYHQASEPKPAYANPDPPPQTSRGRGKWTVAVLASLLTAIVVGGAVGGGLGSTLSDCQNEKRALSDHLGSSLSTLTITIATTATITASAAATTTPTTSTAFIPVSPTDVPLLALSCVNGTVQETAHRSATFQEYCGIDFGSNQVSTTKDDSGNSLPLFDILGVIVYSLSDCYQACLTLNDHYVKTDGDSSSQCRSVVFNANLADSVEQVGANCWIKNGTPADISSLPVDLDNTFLSAELVST